MMKRHIFLAGLFAAVALVGCGGGGGGTTPGPVDPSVRFVNAIPDSSAIDFSVNDTVKASSVIFGGASANFTSVNPDLYDLGIREHGDATDLWLESSEFLTDKDYLVIGVGEKSYGSEDLKRPRVVVTEVNRTVPNGTKARLIVTHAFLRGGGFDTPSIDFANPGDNPQFRLTNIPFGGSQTIDVDAGTQTFEVKRNGAEVTYVTATPLTLAAGKIYLALVSGIESNSGSLSPRIRLIELQAR